MYFPFLAEKLYITLSQKNDSLFIITVAHYNFKYVNNYKNIEYLMISRNLEDSWEFWFAVPDSWT